MLLSHKLERIHPLGVLSAHSNSLSNQSLVELLKKGDAASQRAFYKEYFGKMLGIALRYTSNKDDAYDIINTAFYKVFKSICNYKNQGSFDGWVAVIVKRTALDHCRKAKFQYTDIDETPQVGAKVTNDALGQFAVEDIYACIQKLPDASRTVFNMFAIEGYRHDEIAHELGISTGTSKWHVANARKILQKLLIQLK